MDHSATEVSARGAVEDPADRALKYLSRNGDSTALSAANPPHQTSVGSLSVLIRSFIASVMRRALVALWRLPFEQLVDSLSLQEAAR